MKRRAAMAALGPLLLACRPPWTVRRIADAEAAGSSREGHRFDATEYVDSIWDARVVPAAQQAMSFDEWRRGHAAAAQLVKGSGRVVVPPGPLPDGAPSGPGSVRGSVPSRESPAQSRAQGAPRQEVPMGLRPTEAPEDAAGRSRGISNLGRVFRGAVPHLLVDVPPYDGQPDLKIDLGTAIRGTVLRDALSFIQFSQFVNQVDFAKVASALNVRAARAVQAALAGLAEGAGRGSEGAEVSFAGAVAIPQDNGLPEMIPVILTVSRERG